MQIRRPVKKLSFKQTCRIKYLPKKCSLWFVIAETEWLDRNQAKPEERSQFNQQSEQAGCSFEDEEGSGEKSQVRNGVELSIKGFHKVKLKAFTCKYNISEHQ